MRTLFFPLAAVLAVTALPAQTLTTTFAGGNGQAGNMFDLQAITPVTITDFDVNLDPGTWDLEVYVLPANTPYLPDVNNAVAWGAPLATVTGVLSLGGGVPTPLNLGLSVAIAAGDIQAFYVTVTNGTAINYTNGTTTGALFASSAHLEFFEGSGVAYPFTANFNPRVFNGNIHYTFPAGSATSVKYGSSCDFPTQAGERFAQGDPVDLANTSWLLIDNGFGGWDISPSGFPYDATGAQANGTEIRDVASPWAGAFTSSSCACWDDATVVITPVTTGLTYPDPATGASIPYTQISLNTNGSIRLGDQGVDNSFAFNGGNSGFVSTVFQGTVGPMLPQFAAFYNDMDLDAAGSLWVEDANGQLRITWDGVPNWDDPAGPAPQTNDIQITFLPGLVSIAFGPNLGNGGSGSNEAIVGWSQGDSSANNRLDWTVAMAGSYTTGSGFAAPTTNSTATPVLGTSINIVVDGLSPTAVIGGVIYGLTPLNPGISLGGVIGINCDLLATLDLIELGAPVAGTYTSNAFAIPNNPALAGQSLGAQGFGLDTGLIGASANELNPLGATLGDAVLLTIGL